MYKMQNLGKNGREETDEEKVGKDKTKRYNYCLHEKWKTKQ